MPRMTKSEAQRLTAQENTLVSLGFTSDEAETLRRINSTLRRWYEMECGNDRGAIERNDATGRPYWCAEVGNTRTGFRIVQTPIPDREAGALRRLSRIVKARNERSIDALDTYIQTDPRGAALYILRPGEIPAGCSVESCYTRGVCVF